MRPVLLEMDGFASFRQRTVVDFDDVEYFALVGPTGAGKSTVIDAITFALYGSVARWDDVGAVAPALAPAVNRGTVRLVFDARGARYVVMRELRRNANGKVTQKTARLERLVDPAARGGLDDAVENLGGSIRDTAEAVGTLLGLDFNQFTKCVALPQGEFAEFLHAPPAERDRILTKLLGLDVYVTLGRTAGARAARLTTTADAWQSQLEQGEADLSDEALDAATARHEALRALTARLEEDLQGLSELQGQLLACTATRQRHERELALLVALAVPEDVSDLDARMLTAGQARDIAKKSVAQAEAADMACRAAVRDHAPRAELERLAAHHRELQQLTAQTPALEQAVAATCVARELAGGQRADAARAMSILAVEEATAAAEAAKADADRATVRARLTLLQGVQAPAELSGLLEAVTAAQGAAVAARVGLEAARQEHQAAITAAADVAEAVLLERAGGALTAAHAANDGLGAALPALGAAHERARMDRAASDDAERTLSDLEQAVRTRHIRHVASSLRAGLLAGEDCPVCEQTVHSTPPSAGTEDEDQAQADAELDSAKRAARRASDAAARGEANLTGASQTLRAAHAALAQALAAAPAALACLHVSASAKNESGALSMPAVPDIEIAGGSTLLTSPAELAAWSEAVGAGVREVFDALGAAQRRLDAGRQQRGAADATVSSAAQQIARAERSAGEAQEQARTLEVRGQALRESLRLARDPLVAHGAPVLDDGDLPTAWATLQEWAGQQAREQREAVGVLAVTAGEAAGEHERVRAALAQAVTTQQQAGRQYDLAVSRDERAQAEHTAVTARAAELARLLMGERDASAVTGELAVLSELELAGEAARLGLEAARVEHAKAERLVGELGFAYRAAQAELAAARDPLVALGAPAVTETPSLLQGWSALTDWAEQARQGCGTSLAAAVEQHERLAGLQEASETAIRGALSGAGVPAADTRPVAAWAAPAAAAAREQAAAAVRALTSARARAASLAAQIRGAREQAAVAQQLARLLAMNGFARYLSKSALEVLVSAASSTLLELSGGQFELAVADNDAASFTVIDHTDADAERPVKTLSGGETFQASLSLALALSTHLGALASNGAAQLEAIFIDEGFGTLDENTLDTVATTLETLATSAGRMVGVITHVPGLAARVPVQFAVRRDGRGSSIERVQR